MGAHPAPVTAAVRRRTHPTLEDSSVRLPTPLRRLAAALTAVATLAATAGSAARRGGPTPADPATARTRTVGRPAFRRCAGQAQGDRAGSQRGPGRGTALDAVQRRPERGPRAGDASTVELRCATSRWPSAAARAGGPPQRRSASWPASDDARGDGSSTTPPTRGSRTTARSARWPARASASTGPRRTADAPPLDRHRRRRGPRTRSRPPARCSTRVWDAHRHPGRLRRAARRRARARAATGTASTSTSATSGGPQGLYGSCTPESPPCTAVPQPAATARSTTTSAPASSGRTPRWEPAGHRAPTSSSTPSSSPTTTPRTASSWRTPLDLGRGRDLRRRQRQPATTSADSPLRRPADPLDLAGELVRQLDLAALPHRDVPRGAAAPGCPLVQRGVGPHRTTPAGSLLGPGRSLRHDRGPRRQLRRAVGRLRARPTGRPRSFYDEGARLPAAPRAARGDRPLGNTGARAARRVDHLATATVAARPARRAGAPAPDLRVVSRTPRACRRTSRSTSPGPADHGERR